MFEKVCNVDLKSGILCPKCEEKLSSGEVSELDLKVARILLELEKNYSALQGVRFCKSIESGSSLVILVQKGDVPLILGYGGKILKEISRKIEKKRVRVLAYNDEPRRFLEDLFAPASVLTVNKLWLPDGSIETKVILQKRDMKKLPASIEALKDLAKSIMNIPLRVEFEGPSFGQRDYIS